MTDSNQPKVGVVNKPLLRVNVGACEVTYIKPEERADKLAEAKEYLARYGRNDRIEMVAMYETALRAHGKTPEEMPLVLMTTITDTADMAATNYAIGPAAARVQTQTGAGPMQLKPEVVHYEGLDASKEVSEADPHRYLIMPFQARAGDASGGIMMTSEAFDEWLRGVPREQKQSEAVSN